MAKFWKTAGRLILPIVLGIIAIGGAVTSVYFYQQNAKLKANPQAVTDSELKKVVAEVGNLMFLPPDETPTVLTINDMEKLKDQPFFANAKIGYKVLVYTKAKKVIMYDPVSKKIVEIAPFNSNTDVSAQNTSTTPATPTISEIK